MSKKKPLIISSVVAAVALLGGMSYYQSTHFNSEVTINDVNVGGLTATQALEKLEGSVLKNEVYIGQEKIVDEEDTKAGFTKQDLDGIQDLLQDQQTFFPSSSEHTFTLMPSESNEERNQRMRKLVEEKLTAMNQGLEAPQDAQARLENGNIVVSKSKDGKQYDIAKLLEGYDQQSRNSEIRLEVAYLQPVREDSQIVKDGEKMLQDLVQRTVEYKVQDKVHTLKASDLIKNASVSKDMQYTIDTAGIKQKLSEINTAQSTLRKNFTFTTHSGAVIQVKGESYGWAIDVDKEAAYVQEAFVKGTATADAANIYGIGYNKKGVGYNITTNNGIGGTYAEVSISEQRIWLYKNGQMVFTTHVVTGRHDTKEDTPPGVWYIMYKESPSTLDGSRADSTRYSVKVDYWAPFTNSGCGFHDASWRSNWTSTAYLTQGSGGCVNTPPSVMKAVYDNLSKNDPVVIY